MCHQLYWNFTKRGKKKQRPGISGHFFTYWKGWIHGNRSKCSVKTSTRSISGDAKNLFKTSTWVDVKNCRTLWRFWSANIVENDDIWKRRFGRIAFFNSPSPILFSFIFGLCKQTNYTILQKMTKCPYSIQCYDLNPIPPEHESPPITTRPGLPPQGLQFFNARGPTHEVLKHFSRVKFADCR